MSRDVVRLLGRLLCFEALEKRTFLSADPAGWVTPPSGSEYSPQEVAAAYGDSNIYFGTAAGNGAGQTIAIIVQGNDPTIIGDLAHFDAAFGLPDPPNFTVVNQTGSTTNLPPTSTAFWYGEESQDVEWAHAMAPGASIVVVDANSGLSNLLAAAPTAAQFASVVSMSLGSTGEVGAATEQANDPNFTASGVTFLAAAGDTNAGAYPAFSPNVVAVGGTVLSVSSNNGAPPYAYVSETAWRDTGGGTSKHESEPAYQDAVQSTGKRTIPDVSADAGSPAWVYNSNAAGSAGGWVAGVGNSLSTPIWAGLIAIADQGRVEAGLPTLSGRTQTLPALYSLEATSPGDFHDITSGSNGTFSAGPGYDEVTGLGSPIANLLVPGLVGDGTLGAATQLTVTAQPPSSATTGSAFSLTVVAEDASGTIDPTYNGPVTISLANKPGGGTLGGTVTETAVDGIATYNNLTISQAGNGYTLQAAANGLATATMGSINVVDAPVVTPSGTTNLFRIGGAAIAVDSGVLVSSRDTNLSGATITINNVQPGDTLNFTNSDGITGSYSPGVLTLSGSATVAQYQTALQSVTFSTSSTNTITRWLSIITDDGSPDDLDGGAAAESIEVAVAAPLVTPAQIQVDVSALGGGAVAVDPGVTVSSSDPDLSGATVTIDNVQSGDSLNFTNQSGISGSYFAGVLTLSGSATPAQYQAALESVTFSTTDTGTTTRAFTIIAIDATATYGALYSNPNNAPILTPSGTTNTFTLGGSSVAVDSGLTISSFDIDLIGATITITNFQTGDTLTSKTLDGVVISGNSGGVLTLSTAEMPLNDGTVTDYQRILQSINFSTTSTNTVPRSLSIVVNDGSASPTSSNTVAETVDVAIPPPVVTASGTPANYTAGASPVVLDPGITVSSYDTDLSGATVTISPDTLQAGDALNFTNPGGISGSYATGVLTLSGSATPAQYQAALQSVTFSSTSTSTTTRAISIVVSDGLVNGSSASEAVNVSAPVTITGLYVNGTTWSTFDTYLGAHGFGSTSLGYALLTGSSQLTPLPWSTMNEFDIQFSGPVTGITTGSIELVGGTGGAGNAATAPTVTSVTSLGGNAYQISLSSNLGYNNYIFAIASTGSSFGPAVVDANGAGISGLWTNGSSAFPSGNGLAGSTFDFQIDVLPGDANQDGTVNSQDSASTTALANDKTTGTTSVNYSPFVDINANGTINSQDSAVTITNVNLATSNITNPTAPSGGLVGGDGSVGFTALALGVQETSSSTSTVSNVVSAGSSYLAIGSTMPATTTGMAGNGSVSAEFGSSGSGNTAAASTSHALAATDAAVSGFDLGDLWA